MYKVIGSPKTRAGRVIWALEELGAAYDVVDCMPHAPEVTAVSPLGKLPVLVDGDMAVTDSTAILFHLADKHDALTFPTGSAERSRMTSLMQFALDDLERPLWTAARHAFILPEDLRRGEALAPSIAHEMETGWRNLGALIGDAAPYAFGEAFTIADVLIGHVSGWAKGSGFPAPEGPMADYTARLRARPAWRRVLERIKAL